MKPLSPAGHPAMALSPGE